MTKHKDATTRSPARTGQGRPGIATLAIMLAFAPGESKAAPPATSEPIAQVLAETLATLPEIGVTVSKQKILLSDGTPMEKVLGPQDEAADWSALVATEEGVLWQQHGAATKAVASAMSKAAPGELLPVVVWTSRPMPWIRKELLEEAPEKAQTELDELEASRQAAISELLLLLAGYGVAAQPLAGIPAVGADLPAELVQVLAKEIEVGRIGLASKGVIPTSATSSATVGAEEVHGWGWTGAGRKLGIILADKPNSTPCLSFASRRWLTTTSSAEAKVALGAAKASTTATCTPVVPGVAPGVALYSADPLASGGCDGVCWALQQGATLIAAGWAEASSMEYEAVIDEHDATLDSLVKLPPFPLIVASAGNSNGADGSPCSSHADAGYVQNHFYSGLVVGGMNEAGTESPLDDALYTCSSWRNPASPNGDRELPHLVAPAVDVQSADAGPSTGTSIATAVTAGVAALVVEANQSLASWPEALRAILMASAHRDYDGTTVFGCTDESTGCGRDGHGLVSAPRALRLASSQQHTLGAPGSSATLAGHDFGTMVFATDFPNGFYHRGGDPVRWKVEVPPGTTTRVVLAWDSTGVPGSGFSDVPDADLDLHVYDSQSQLVAWSCSWDRVVESTLVTNSGSTTEVYEVAVYKWSSTSASTYFGLAFQTTDDRAPDASLRWPVSAAVTTMEPTRVRPVTGTLEVGVRIDDDSPLAVARVYVDSEWVEVQGTGDQVVQVPMRDTGSGPQIRATLSVVAVDVHGNRTAVSAPIFMELSPPPATTITIGVSAGMPEHEVDDLAALVDGVAVYAGPGQTTWLIHVPDDGDLHAAARTLMDQEGVQFATVNEPARPDALPACSENMSAYPDDPAYGAFVHQWHLHQPAGESHYFGYGGLTVGSGACTSQNPCLFGTCDEGFCRCASDSDCRPGTVCAAPDGPDDLDDGYGDRCPNPKNGACVACSRSGADIGWEEAKEEICAVQEHGPEVLIAIADVEGLFAWKHPELMDRVWTNGLECCGAESCPDTDGDGLPDCTAGEHLTEGQSCVPEPTTCHCAVPGVSPQEMTQALVIPLHGRCVITKAGTCAAGVCSEGYPGRACSTDSDCVPKFGDFCWVPGMNPALATNGNLSDCGYAHGVCSIHPDYSQVGERGVCTSGPNQGGACEDDEDCGYTVGVCAPMGPFSMCTDGRPGRRDVDDDGDGFPDVDCTAEAHCKLGDPEVHRMIWGPKTGLLTNGLDDDLSCCDANFVCTPQPDPCYDNPEEALLAAFDDDEDGYIDDVHGVDIALIYSGANGSIGFEGGHLWGTTHDDFAARAYNHHGTATAGLAGATVHNANDMAGVMPTARLLALSWNSEYVEEALVYAAQAQAQVFNLSAGRPEKTTSCENHPYPAQCQAATMLSWTKRLHAVIDPNTLYVFSAGNSRFDLDQSPNPVGGVEVLAPWRFPQSIWPKRWLIVGASDFHDRFVDWWWGCDAAMWATPGLKNLCYAFPPGASEVEADAELGSNRGPTYVDLAAPGVHISSTDAYLAAALVLTYKSVGSGTSWSAPIAAGSGAVLISAAAERYAHRPLLVIERLRGTATKVASDQSASYIGMTGVQGRVDLSRALDEESGTLPEPPVWDDVTFELADAAPGETHGVALFRQSVWTGSQMETVDVLFRAYGGTGTGSLVERQPTLQVKRPGEARFTHWTTTLPYLRGSYSAVEHGDLNGDGCVDLVLAGQLQVDPSPPPGQKPFKGRRDAVLLQHKNAGRCLGTFYDTSTPVSANHLLTTNVAVADVNGDGALDVMMPGVHTAQYGLAQSNTRLYLGNGTGGFTDASALIAEDTELHGFALRPCDVDGDGDLDLVEAGKRTTGFTPSERRPRILLNQMTAGQPATLAFTVADPVAWGLPSLARVHEVSCADVDGDGDMDLLLARQQAAKNVLLLNTGTGSFTDGSDSLPDLGTGAGGFDYLHHIEVTQAVTACFLEDAPGVATLFYANGKASEKHWQPNAVMRPGEGGHFVSAHTDLGFRFDTLYGQTEDILCFDLDGNGLHDTVFLANTGGRDHLYRWAGGAP